MLQYSQVSFALYAWSQKADFGGGVRDADFGFSIGNYGYAGTGKNPAEQTDFWQYDPSNDVWTQKADYTGLGRYGLIGFAIGSYGYAGLGWTGSGGGGNQYRDFWQYDPSNNTWTAKADFGGAGRYSAVGFTIGNKGYAGLGFSPLHNDFWEYDPALNNWTQKMNFPSVRQAAVGVGVGNKGYVGTGYAGTSSYNDFYEFDPVNNTWTAKSNVPGLLRRGAVAFSIGNYAYLGMGYNDSTYLTDFSRYDPVLDQWTVTASIGGVPRYGAFAFSIANYGYVGTGSYGGIVAVIRTSDFWRFEDCDGSSIGIREEPANMNNVYMSVRSEPRVGLVIDYNLDGEKDGLFDLYDGMGKLVLTKVLKSDRTNIIIPAKLSSDIYFYSLTGNERILNSGKVVIFN